MKKPYVLAILDGWGIAPDSEGNAITRAKTPNMDKFIRDYPAMTLLASGNEVGLSFGEMGNSEVGHLNIGAGRIYYQTFPRINKTIDDGSFFGIKAFVEAIEHVKKNKSQLHLLGLVGMGNVHASQKHLYALLELAKKHKLNDVYIHAILDGRDTLYNAGIDFITELKTKIKELKIGQIATLCGRYFAMDRDNRWDRVEKAYNAIACGKATRYYKDVLDAIHDSYNEKVYDEEFVATVIGKEDDPVTTVRAGDAVIFFNFRPDRARQLTESFVLPAFAKFEREYIKNVFFVTMTEYEKEIPVRVAFPPVVAHNCFAEVISKAGLSQFHIAETEKYAHITFFLNGTVEDPFPDEERQIIPSPKVANYAQAPEMSAKEISKQTISAIESDKYDVLCINFANADMVGHTGDIKATIQGCEIIDKGLGAITEHVLAKEGVMCITADHGNAEEVINLQTDDMDKEHSTNPVPFIIISHDLKGQSGPAGDPPDHDLSLMPPVGVLADVVPTILHLMNVDKPDEMTGRALM